MSLGENCFKRRAQRASFCRYSNIVSILALTLGLSGGISIFLATGLARADTPPSPSPSPNPSPSIGPTWIESKALPPTGKMPMEDEALSLERCITIALKSATEVLKAQNNTHFTGEQLLQAYAQFLPNLDTQATYSYLSGTDYFTSAVPTLVVGQNVGIGYVVSSSLNIFNGFSDFSHLKASLLKRDSANLTLLRAKQKIILDTTQSFLQTILDNEIVKIAKKNLTLSKERQTLLEEQTKVGVRNLSDLFRQQAQTSSDELFLANSLNKERSDQILLLRKLRLDVAKDYQWIQPEIEEGKPDARFQDESKLIQIGLENRSDLKSADQLADAGEWEVKQNQGSYYPRLDLGLNVYSAGRYFQQQIVNGVNYTPALQQDLLSQLGTQTYYTVGLTVTFNLFDRWVNRFATAKAQVASDNLQIDALDRKLQVEGEVRQSFGDYQTSLQQLESTKKGLEAAQKAYEVTQGRYEVGSASFVDLITAQTALLQAESNRVQSLIGFLLQGKVMDYALGTSNVSLL